MLKELRHCEARFLRRGNPLILKHFLDCFAKNARNDGNEVLRERFLRSNPVVLIISGT